jgi:hypothetical protein
LSCEFSPKTAVFNLKNEKLYNKNGRRGVNFVEIIFVLCCGKIKCKCEKIDFLCPGQMNIASLVQK